MVADVEEQLQVINAKPSSEKSWSKNQDLSHQPI